MYLNQPMNYILVDEYNTVYAQANKKNKLTKIKKILNHLRLKIVKIERV